MEVLLSCLKIILSWVFLFVSLELGNSWTSDDFTFVSFQWHILVNEPNLRQSPVALIHYTRVMWSLIYSCKGWDWFEIGVCLIMYTYSHVLGFTGVIDCRSSRIFNFVSQLWLICLSYEFLGSCLCRCSQWCKYRSLFYFLTQYPIF